MPLTKTRPIERLAPGSRVACRAVLIVGALGLSLVASSSPVAGALPVVRIGIVQDGPSEQLATELPRYRDEILALTEGEWEVRFEPRHQLVGDWTRDGVDAAVEALLSDPEVDLIVALGVLASQRFCCRGPLPKPVVAPVVLEPRLQGLPVLSDGSSGIPNLSFIALTRSLERDLEAFASVASFHSLAFVTNEALFGVIPEFRDRIQELTASRGFDTVFHPVGDSAARALETLPPGVDAVYLYPIHHLTFAEKDRLIAGLVERGLPSFSWLGRPEVERGVLMGLGADTFHSRLSRRVALHVQSILLGEPPEKLSTRFTIRQELSINMATARAIDVWPTWDQLVAAHLVDTEVSEGPLLTMESAVEEAVAANLDLLAGTRGVEAGEARERRARSALRPQLDASALGLQIDEDRASSTFVPQAERTVTGTIGLSQVLWAEELAAASVIEGRLQAARVEELEGLRLDVTQQIATAYLDVLRAQTAERIQRQNLELTRSNLELARVRQSLGAATASEVARWESQLAGDSKSLVDARASHDRARLVFNRLLHRPLEAPFVLSDVDLRDELFVTADERLPVYARDPKRYRLFRDFMVEEGLAASVELERLDQLVAAKERELVSARRSFWSPDVVLSAGLDEELAEGGAGADATGPPGITLPDDTSWNVALSVSLPLFDGGARAAAVSGAGGELAELQLTRDTVAERIELRIRGALHAANATYQGIELSAAAADAARRNLELVTDAYAQGVVSIVDLLDAQNAALVAEQVAASAVYEFLIDLMEVQRAANRFDFFLGAGEREAWFQRLESFLRAAGAQLEE